MTFYCFAYFLPPQLDNSWIRHRRLRRTKRVWINVLRTTCLWDVMKSKSRRGVGNSERTVGTNVENDTIRRCD